MEMAGGWSLPGFPRGESSLGSTTTPPPPGAGFKVSTGAEGDEAEDGCHEWGRVGSLHTAEPRERG